MCKDQRVFLKNCSALQPGQKDQRNILWQKWTVNMCIVMSLNTGVLSMKRLARVTIRLWKWPSHSQHLVRVCGHQLRATGPLIWRKVIKIYYEDTKSLSSEETMKNYISVISSRFSHFFLVINFQFNEFLPISFPLHEKILLFNVRNWYLLPWEQKMKEVFSIYQSLSNSFPVTYQAKNPHFFKFQC